MKWLSYILTLGVMFLTVQPTIALANMKGCSEYCGSCCGNDKDTQKQDKPVNKDCSSKNCNPFQSCGNCLGFTVKTSFFKIEAPAIQKSITFLFKENSISQFSSDVWQPPKIS